VNELIQEITDLEAYDYRSPEEDGELHKMKLRLAELQREQSERDRDARRRDLWNGNELPLARLMVNESEQRCIAQALSTIGKEVYELRAGGPMQRQYSYDGYERDTVADFESYLDWPEGTPVIRIRYYWSHNGGGESQTVVFPETYLDTDWRPIEEALNVTRAAKKEAARAAENERNAARDRETYERLKSQFGDNA
jgi:hypothetical protein